MPILIASLLGGLLIAVSAGVLISLFVSSDNLSRIIAGALATLLFWIPAMLLGFTAETGWLAWQRIISILFIFGILSFLLVSAEFSSL